VKPAETIVIDDEEFRRRRRARSIAIAIALGVLIAIFYALTLVKLGGAVPPRP
jgi:hypothetical protein